MKNSITCAGLVILTILLPLTASAKEPSAASLDKLLELTQVQKQAAGSIEQINGMMANMINQSFAKQTLTPEQQKELQKVMPAFSEKLKTIVSEEMSWKKMKDSYAKVYRKNFTQEEVDGLIAFYQSASGKAFLKKMPGVTQEFVQLGMERLPAITERLQSVSAEMQQKLKAAGTK